MDRTQGLDRQKYCNPTSDHVFRVLCGVASLSATVRLLSNRMDFGLCVGAILMSTPVVLGIGATNVKDAPVAIGLTLVSCGGALVLASALQARRSTDSGGSGALLTIGTTNTSTQQARSGGGGRSVCAQMLRQHQRGSNLLFGRERRGFIPEGGGVLPMTVNEKRLMPAGLALD